MIVLRWRLHDDGSIFVGQEYAFCARPTKRPHPRAPGVRSISASRDAGSVTGNQPCGEAWAPRRFSEATPPQHYSLVQRPASVGPSSVRGKVEVVALAGLDRPHVISHTDPDLPFAFVVVHEDRQFAVPELHVERGTPEAHGKRQTFEPIRQLRVEVECPIPDIAPQKAALYQVQGPGHDPHVDALLGGTVLDVADVALEGGQEHVP